MMLKNNQTSGRKVFEIAWLPILVKVSNKKKLFSNGREFMIQQTNFAIAHGQTYTVKQLYCCRCFIKHPKKLLKAFRNTWNAREGIDKKTKRPYRIQR
jgi:hypothetical protein